MQISEYKNVSSVNNYSSISENQQKNISNIISNTTDENMAAVVPYTPHTQSKSNLPRRTSTVTGPVTTTTISALAVCQSDHDELSPSFCSQTNMSNQIQSMFNGSTLHVGTLNVYIHSNSEKPAQ